MEERYRTAIIDSFEKGVSDMGFNLYKVGPRMKSFLEARLPMLSAMSSREALDAYLATAPPTDEAYMQQAVMLFAALPQLLTTYLNETTRRIAENLPPAPAGRPKRVTPEIKREIVGHIGTLFTKGVQLSDAQGRAALRFGVSRRTVQRVWRERHTFAAQPFLSIHDVLKFLGL